jgi:stress-induced-phosphoprotein 1
LRKGQALTKAADFEGARTALEAGLKVDANDKGINDAMVELERAENAPPAGGGMGGLFGPQMLAKLAGHPKFGPKLADPAFQQKLQMMQTNPQAMLADPEMMEVLQAIIGAGNEGGDFGAMGMGGDTAAPQTSYQAPPRVPEPIPQLSPEEQAKADVKKNALAAKERGNKLYKEKKFDEAIAAYDEAFSHDSTNMMFMNNKAAVYVEMGQTDKAIEICEAALEVGKANRAGYEETAKVLQRKASAYLKAGDLKTAIEWYGKAQLEHFDKAIDRKVKLLTQDFKKAEKAAYINPELGLAAKERGNAAFREGKFPDAIKEYEEAIKRDPTNAPFRNNLAAAYLKMGLFNDGKREVEKSLEIDPKYVKAWAKKGDIEMFMKEYHKALESYKAGLQLEPDNSLCKKGLQEVGMKINSQSDAEIKERQAHAMADPEIQQILQDPSVRQILTDMQENPAYAQKAMSDPNTRAKIDKLIAAGVLQVK